MADHDDPVDPQLVDAVRREGLPAAEAEAMAGLLTLLADPLRARIIDREYRNLGSGLTGMAERLRAVGGTLDLVSTPG